MDVENMPNRILDGYRVRCAALEFENEKLREEITKIRKLAELILENESLQD